MRLVMTGYGKHEFSQREQAQTDRARLRNIGAMPKPRLIKKAKWADDSRDTGDKLRAIRAERGVGRPLKNQLDERYYRPFSGYRLARVGRYKVPVIGVIPDMTAKPAWRADQAGVAHHG